MPDRRRNQRRLIKWMVSEWAAAFANIARRLVFPVQREYGPGDPWCKKPGLGIMYQIEYRPGMDWDRDYEKFNPSMMDENGKFKFNGPFCKIADWVELSRQVAVDYHIFESKWHDGICYFDTKLTDWRTDTDYCAEFAEGSRRAGIPFMYYYSTVFDHNPRFDALQPDPHSTFSDLSMDPQQLYEEYLKGQFKEIMERYRPDGMWFDWYWPDRATDLTIEYFRAHHPDTAITFNLSHYFPSAYKRLDYTTGEAHDLFGNFVKLVRTGDMTLPIFTGAWKWAALGRRVLDHPTELISPAGKWWQDPSLRDDPNDLIRMTAIILASGAKFCLGATSQMNGDLYPDQVKQLHVLGQWYRPRKHLFLDSVPLAYRAEQAPGIKVSPSSVKTIAVRNQGDTMVHLINLDGVTRPIAVEFKGRRWKNIVGISLEPSGKPLPLENDRGVGKTLVRKEDIDPVDMILRLRSA